MQPNGAAEVQPGAVPAEAEARKPLLTVLRRPLAPVAVCMMLGIAAAAYAPVPAAWCLCALLAAVIAALILRALEVRSMLPLLLAAFLGGFTLLTLSLPGWAADAWAPADEAHVRGTVVDVGFTSSGAAQYTLDGVAVDGKPMAGRVLVTVKGKPGGGEGDLLTAFMQLKRPDPSLYYGGFNARGYYLRHGIRFTGFAASPEITASGQAALWGLPASARQYAADLLNRHLSPGSAALVSALLSGDKSGISGDVSGAFVHLGVAHLLAVSGLNISLTAGAVWLLCRKLSVPMPVSYALSLLVMACYVLFAGFTPSVARAAVMWAAMMAGMAAGRRYDPLSSISAAAIVILALNPLDLFDVGFQLSFAATAAMFLWLAPLMRHAPRKRWMRALAGSVGVTVCVTALALPIILACFNSVSLMSPLANLVLVPLSFLLQLAGMALLLTGVIPGIAETVGAVLDWAARFYLDNVRLLDWAGASIAAATPPVWLAAVFTLLAAAVSPALIRLRAGARAAAAALLMATVALMLLPMPGWFTGRGDAAVIAESGGSVSVYWQEGGKRYAACEGRARELAGYLKSRGVTRLDGLYLHGTKPPRDGSALLALRGVRSDTLVVPQGWLANPDAAALLEQGTALGMRPVGGEERSDILTLALPAELARAFSDTYNITDCGSVELYGAGSALSAAAWRDGWENGLQGSFR